MGRCNLCNNEVLLRDGVIESYAHKYWSCRYSPGWVVGRYPINMPVLPPNAQRMGGPVLDSPTKYIITGGRFCPNYEDKDPKQPILIKFGFETGEDNSGGSLSDIITIEVSMGVKHEGENTLAFRSIDRQITIGQAPIYTFLNESVQAPDDGSYSKEASFIIRVRFLPAQSVIGSILVTHLAAGYATIFSSILAEGCED